MDDRMVKTDNGTPAVGSGQEHCCLNCNTPLTDQFCPHDDQRNFHKGQTLKAFSFNFFSSFTGYESKFFITVRYLLLNPGFLAAEYNSGKRERYFHPARMYVFISFIYFLIFTLTPVALKRFYKQSWGKTLLKYSAFLILFGICTLVGLFINLFITLIFF